MIDLSTARNFIGNSLGRTGLVVSKFSPEILIGVGVAGMIVSTVMACKATLKAQDVMRDGKKTLKILERAKTEKPEEYSEEDYKKDLIIAHVQRNINLARLYLPAVAVGAASIGCILGSHHILSKRNAAMAAAYKVVDETFKDYRKRVAARLGEDEEKMIRHGLKSETVEVTETDENGKERKRTMKRCEMAEGLSQYAKVFDKSSPMFKNNHDNNLFFLRSQQIYANDMLRIRGHIFLNEVYDCLGIPRTEDGAVVGWVLGGDGNNYVDFGIYKPECDNGDFINGYDNYVILDFNVDGLIYDKI